MIRPRGLHLCELPRFLACGSCDGVSFTIWRAWRQAGSTQVFQTQAPLFCRRQFVHTPAQDWLGGSVVRLSASAFYHVSAIGRENFPASAAPRPRLLWPSFDAAGTRRTTFSNSASPVFQSLFLTAALPRRVCGLRRVVDFDWEPAAEPDLRRETNSRTRLAVTPEAYLRGRG